MSARSAGFDMLYVDLEHSAAREAAHEPQRIIISHTDTLTPGRSSFGDPGPVEATRLSTPDGPFPLMMRQGRGQGLARMSTYGCHSDPAVSANTAATSHARSSPRPTWEETDET
jgi:hypothetical protein